MLCGVSVLSSESSSGKDRYYGHDTGSLMNCRRDPPTSQGCNGWQNKTKRPPGSNHGQILDSTGAAMPGADVRAIQTATQYTRTGNYRDREHNDEHHWDNRKDRAYRMWAKENHRKYRDFSKLRENDQQSYWGWRHSHSDAQLRIDIR